MKAQIRMIIASVIVIALALTAVSGITYSWFSDTEEAKIEITTAKVNYDATFVGSVPEGLATLTEASTATTGYAASFNVSNIVAKTTIKIDAEITNSSTIKTVYQVILTPKYTAPTGTTDYKGFTPYDLKNILVQTYAGSTTDMVAQKSEWTVGDDGILTSATFNSIVIKDWTEVDSTTTDVGTVTAFISIPTTYGGALEAPVIAFNPDTGEGSTVIDETYTKSWDAQIVRSGLSFEMKIVAVQGDYPYTLMEKVGDTETVSATIPTNKVVKANSITTSEAGSDEKVNNVVLDFSNVSTATDSESASTNITGTKVTAEVTNISSTDSTVTIDLNLFSVDGTTKTLINSPTFDKDVVITMTVPGKITEPKITYNGVEDGKILSSTINSDNTTTVVFSVTHFSEYVIADTLVTTAEGLQASLNAGGYVKLGADITDVSQVLVCKKSGTVLDLNGHKISTSQKCLLDVQASLTITGGTLQSTNTEGAEDATVTVLKVVDQTADITLTLQSVNVISPTDGIRNSSIYASNNTGEVVIDIDGGKLIANHYPLNVRSGNTNIKFIVNDATIQGYCALQSHSYNSIFEFTNCDLIGLNQWDIPGKPTDNDFAVIVLYNDATGSEVKCTGCTISAVKQGTAKEYLFDLRSVSTIVLNDCNYLCEGDAVGIEDIIGGSYTYISTSDIESAKYDIDGNVLTIKGQAYTVSTANHLTEAITGGKSVKLANDITCDVVVPADKSATLDLNGYTLTNVSGHTITVNEKASLYLWDSSSSGNGKVDNVSDGKAAIKALQNSITVIDGGTFERSAEERSAEGTSNSYYTIENWGNMVINGAKINNTGSFSSMIRVGYENDGTIYVGSLTLNGCKLNGGLNAVKIEPESSLIVNGGELINTEQYVIMNYGTATLNGGTYTSTGQDDKMSCLGAVGVVYSEASSNNTVAKFIVNGGTFSGPHLVDGFHWEVNGSTFVNNPKNYEKTEQEFWDEDVDVTEKGYILNIDGVTFNSTLTTGA